MHRCKIVIKPKKVQFLILVIMPGKWKQKQYRKTLLDLEKLNRSVPSNEKLPDGFRKDQWLTIAKNYYDLQKNPSISLARQLYNKYKSGKCKKVTASQIPNTPNPKKHLANENIAKDSSLLKGGLENKKNDCKSNNDTINHNTCYSFDEVLLRIERVASTICAKTACELAKLNHNKALNEEYSKEHSYQNLCTSIQKVACASDHDGAFADSEKQHTSNQRTSERFFLESDGIDKLTADLLTRSNIPEDGVFTKELKKQSIFRKTVSLLA